MKARKLMGLLGLALVATLGLSACDDDPIAPADEPNIVEIASASADFETLVAAIQAAGLADVLSGEGPFTVFAPTDAAFAALPEGTLDSLLLPENRQLLVDILTYHVVSGERLAADVVAETSLTTLLGQELPVTVDGQVVQVGPATILQVDIEASNGVIHVIDTVLLPQ